MVVAARGSTSAGVSPWRAWYALGALSLATFIGLMDRQMLVVAAEPLKLDLELSDTSLGVIQGFGPLLFAAIATPGMGWLADRMDRRWLLAICMTLWCIATFACGLARSGSTLFVCTVAIGLGETALGPVIYSLIPDLFRGDRRTFANLAYYSLTVLGAGIALAATGGIYQISAVLSPLLPSLAQWRTAFILVAAPGLLVVPLVALIGTVPRGSFAVGAASDKGALARYLRKAGATLGLVFAGYGFIGISVVAVSTWPAMIMVREFGLAADRAGFLVGAGLGSGAVVGVVSGGLLATALHKRRGRYLPLELAQGAGLVSVATALILIAKPSAISLAVGGGVILAASTAAAAMLPGLLQDLAPPALRGRVIGLSTLVYVALQAGGLPLVGSLSDAFADRPHGLLTAMVMVSVPTASAGVLCLNLALRMLRRRPGIFNLTGEQLS